MFYTRVEPDPHLLTGYRELVAAGNLFRDVARRTHDPVRRAVYERKAAEVGRIVRELMRKLDAQAIESAKFADKAIVDTLESRRQRPRTPGPHLADHVTSQPIPTSLPSGAFGIALIDELNKAIGRESGIPYWGAIEWGTGTARIPSQVGRPKVTPGYFQPGDSAPDPAQFRVHPYFQQERYRRGMPALVITKEIEPHYFLRDGSAAALAHHRAELEAIERQTLAEMRRL